MSERRVIYETRLGILGYGPKDIPSADHHNLAVAEADAHIAALRDVQSKDVIQPLLALRDSL